MKFLACLYGFNGIRSVISSFLSLLFIFGSILDLFLSNYIGKMYIWCFFDLICLFVGIFEFVSLSNDLNYFVLYFIRYFQFLLVLLSFVKVFMGFFVNEYIHSSDIVCPMFVLVFVFILTAWERKKYQESKINGRSSKLHNKKIRCLANINDNSDSIYVN